MSRCDCYECNASFRELERKIDALEHRVQSLVYDLERETDERVSAVRSVRNDLSEIYAEVTTR